MGGDSSPLKFKVYGLTSLAAPCSATPATVAATPPCSATPFQTQISVRHLPAQGGGSCDTKIFRGCSATPLLHLQNAIKSRKSAATRVARHVWRDRGYPQSCATKLTRHGRVFLGGRGKLDVCVMEALQEPTAKGKGKGAQQEIKKKKPSFQEASPRAHAKDWNIRRNPKGDGGKGTGKKMSRQFATNVTTIYDMSRQFATFYDNFRLFIPLT